LESVIRLIIKLSGEPLRRQPNLSMVGIETRLQEVELEMQLQNAEQNWMGERELGRCGESHCPSLLLADVCTMKFLSFLSFLPSN